MECCQPVLGWGLGGSDTGCEAGPESLESPVAIAVTAALRTHSLTATGKHIATAI